MIHPDIMTNNRIQQIEQMLAEEPQDPFLHYARCLEYTRISPADGQLFWVRMMQEFPDYVPSYYQAGNCFAELGLKEQALETWKKGADEAARKPDHHALTELKARIQNALIEDDE